MAIETLVLGIPSFLFPSYGASINLTLTWFVCRRRPRSWEELRGGNHQRQANHVRLWNAYGLLGPSSLP